MSFNVLLDLTAQAIPSAAGCHLNSSPWSWKNTGSQRCSFRGKSSSSQRGGGLKRRQAGLQVTQRRQESTSLSQAAPEGAEEEEEDVTHFWCPVCCAQSSCCRPLRPSQRTLPLQPSQRVLPALQLISSFGNCQGITVFLRKQALELLTGVSIYQLLQSLALYY